MIFPSNRVGIMVATKPIDFRKGHDSLAALVKNALHEDPLTGTVFLFRAKKTDQLKLLYLDGAGIVMAYKRLEEHNFNWSAVTDGLMALSHAQFETLVCGCGGGLHRIGQDASERLDVIPAQFRVIVTRRPNKPNRRLSGEMGSTPLLNCFSSLTSQCADRQSFTGLGFLRKDG